MNVLEGDASGRRTRMIVSYVRYLYDKDKMWTSLKRTTEFHQKLRYGLENAEQLLDRFEEVQEQIENLNITEITISEETRKDFEEDFYTIIGKAQNSIIINSISEHSNIQSDVLTTHIKLPTLTLPKFDVMAAFKLIFAVLVLISTVYLVLSWPYAGRKCELGESWMEDCVKCWCSHYGSVSCIILECGNP
ncbi:hypothetical protein QE152_g37916 [Popillia japonica]|uniref:Uncharacterized protein n=1 Tax=Popillia japonica TaxID=7064 RepID=A0AAW1I8I6_POPJA